MKQAGERILAMNVDNDLSLGVDNDLSLGNGAVSK